MTAANIDIRCAGLGDLEEAARLFQRVAQATLHWAPPELYTAEAFLRQAEEEMVWVALDKGRIIGLAALYIPQSFLHSLYIDPPWQGQGVGLALMETVAEAADGPLSLKAETRNTRAIQFYKRHGFRAVEHGHSNGSDWVLLARR